MNFAQNFNYTIEGKEFGSSYNERSYWFLVFFACDEVVMFKIENLKKTQNDL